MKKNYKTINFYGDELRFSAGHFTIFSATHRERLHGHTYFVEASLTAAMAEPGITFDYRLFREQLVLLCRQLDWRFLLAGLSPYVKIEEDKDYYYVEFNKQKIPFLKDDVLILPIMNTTLEDLSQWFLDQIITEKTFIQEHSVCELMVKVFNGPAHSAESKWRNKEK